MIIKVAKLATKRGGRGRGAGSFLRLTKYVTAERVKGREERLIGGWISWGGAAEDGESRYHVDGANSLAEAIELEHLRFRSGERKRKENLTLHIVVSFTPEEFASLREGDVERIEERILDTVGMSGHRRVRAFHEDTRNPHMHLSIDRLDGFGRVVQDRRGNFFDLSRLRKSICRELGWDARGETESEGPAPAGARDAEAFGNEESFHSWLKEHVRADLTALLAEGADWEKVAALLAAKGCQLRKRGAGLVFANPQGSAFVKASSVDRGFSMGALKKRPRRDPGTSRGGEGRLGEGLSEGEPKELGALRSLPGGDGGSKGMETGGTNPSPFPMGRAQEVAVQAQEGGEGEAFRRSPDMRRCGTGTASCRAPPHRQGCRGGTGRGTTPIPGDAGRGADEGNAARLAGMASPGGGGGRCRSHRGPEDARRLGRGNCRRGERESRHGFHSWFADRDGESGRGVEVPGGRPRESRDLFPLRGERHRDRCRQAAGTRSELER